MSTNMSDLDPRLSGPLSQLFNVCNLSITSGKRTNADQTRLFNNSDKSGRMVAKPGSSNHEYGLAADLAGNLACAHAKAGQFGLVFPMSYEPWHIEPIGAKGLRGTTNSDASTGTASIGTGKKFVSNISLKLRIIEGLLGILAIFAGMIMTSKTLRTGIKMAGLAI